MLTATDSVQGFDELFGIARGLTPEEGEKADQARMSAGELQAAQQRQAYEESIRIGLEQDRRDQAQRRAVSKRVRAAYFGLFDEQETWSGRDLIDAAKALCPDISHQVMCGYFMSYCKEYFDSRDLDNIRLRAPEDWGC